MAAVCGATYLDKAGDKAGAARRKDGGKAGREGGGEKRRERAERQEGAEMAKVTTSNPRLSDSDCLGWCLSPEVAGARRCVHQWPVWGRGPGTMGGVHPAPGPSPRAHPAPVDK